MSDGMTERLEKMASIKKQVGGDHYKSMKIQPVEFIHHNKLGFLEGLVIKYVSRHARKNGREDLMKAKHALDLLIDLDYKVGQDSDEEWRIYAKREGGQETAGECGEVPAELPKDLPKGGDK